MKDRFTVDIRGTVQRKNALDPYLIGAHGLLGCDTVGCYLVLVKARLSKHCGMVTLFQVWVTQMLNYLM